jgi:hypothetical protein
LEGSKLLSISQPKGLLAYIRSQVFNTFINRGACWAETSTRGSFSTEKSYRTKFGKANPEHFQTVAFDLVKISKTLLTSSVSIIFP